jgi:tRNA A-37 threonylcarbamoyl transferase component Bud32
MSLQPGTFLGPYEVLSPLGAGGMGEVYKARDTRLDRFVAVKVLPEHLAKHPESMARFEREAKAVAALSHPNITGIFDIGQTEHTTYVAMELLEGESLRTRLEHGPLTPRKATELAIQLAQGLAAAHEKGVVHRDLKPDNLWITKEGRLKILDFGLAKQLPGLGQGSDSYLPTAAISPGHHTEQGMILGTLGYMSPEQVRGETVDARADLFSFGAVLFEMLTGKRAFARGTASDTMAAILRDDPPEMEGTSRPVPLSLRRIIDHCLEKAPTQRFQDAHDVAFALENLSSSEAVAPISAPFAPQNRRTTRIWAAFAVLVMAGMGFGGWAFRGVEAKPTFKRLTFGKGTVDGARFAPASKDILFSARWNGEAPEVFSLNPVALEPRSLGVKGGTLLSVSGTGELAIKMQPRLWASFELGQLARVTPGGGIRVIQESVFDMDWMPDGNHLAVVTSGNGSTSAQPGTSPRQSTLEFPAGHQVSSDIVFTWGIRVSPRGDRLACFEQPSFSRGDGSIVRVELSGNRRVICEVRGFTGLAWGPDGDEIWYSEFKDGSSSLWAVTPAGHRRLLLRQAGLLELLDVAQDGRVLACLGLIMNGTMGMSPPDYREMDLSWNDASFAHDISPDGKRLLIGGGGGWSSGSERLPLYLRTSDGALPTRLGEAASAHFMPNGRQVMTTLVAGNVPALSIVPLGPGQTQMLNVPELNVSAAAEPFPDGRKALIGSARNEPFKVLDLTTGERTPLGEPGMNSTANAVAVSPDGAWVLLRKLTPNPFESPHVLLSTKGAPSRGVKGIEAGEVPLRWNTDGTAIYVFNRDGFPTRIHRIELATGKRTLVREIMPTNPAGLPGIRSFAMTPDARYLAYNYVRKLSDLYLIEGLK